MRAKGIGSSKNISERINFPIKGFVINIRVEINIGNIYST